MKPTLKAHIDKAVGIYMEKAMRDASTRRVNVAMNDALDVAVSHAVSSRVGDVVTRAVWAVAR